VNAPYAVVDARDLINDQLRFNTSVNARQSHSFRSALASLNEALKSKAIKDLGHQEIRQVWSCAESGLETADWTTPPHATVQWMLTSLLPMIVPNGSS
jgi:hypothetical protein